MRSDLIHPGHLLAGDFCWHGSASFTRKCGADFVPHTALNFFDEFLCHDRSGGCASTVLGVSPTDSWNASRGLSSRQFTVTTTGNYYALAGKCNEPEPLLVEVPAARSKRGPRALTLLVWSNGDRIGMSRASIRQRGATGGSGWQRRDCPTRDAGICSARIQVRAIAAPAADGWRYGFTFNFSAAASLRCLVSNVRNSRAPKCNAVATCNTSRLRCPPAMVWRWDRVSASR